MEKKLEDQEFIESVVKSLVNNPDDVSTTREVDEMGVLVTLKVNPEDMGIIIGRGGQNARAIRTLVRVVGAKNNAHVNLRIEEPEGSERVKRATAPTATSAETPAPKEATEEKKEEVKEEVVSAASDVDKAVEDLQL
jgi:uncharacterized protein